MKRATQSTIFDADKRLAQFSKHKDPLLKLESVIDWSVFEPVLDKIQLHTPGKGKGGRPPFPRLLMFKILILQKIYGISDQQMEFQILDRMSFARFLDLSIAHKVPDQNTIWKFRERLKKDNLEVELFDAFYKKLTDEGLILNEGKVIDATFIEAPKQRNTREENKTIKEGNVPEKWTENPDKLAQKDVEARWTKKNDETIFGYKNHIKADVESKFIDKFTVTDAAENDHGQLENLVDLGDQGQDVYADSAYKSDFNEAVINLNKATPQLNERAYRNKPLKEEQIENNRIKSKKRSRVEHIFGYMSISLGGTIVRSIGLARAKVNIGLLNLAYNLMRYTVLKMPIMG